MVISFVLIPEIMFTSFPTRSKILITPLTRAVFVLIVEFADTGFGKTVRLSDEVFSSPTALLAVQ